MIGTFISALLGSLTAIGITVYLIKRWLDKAAKEDYDKRRSKRTSI